jgi:hypothetical protein
LTPALVPGCLPLVPLAQWYNPGWAGWKERIEQQFNLLISPHVRESVRKYRTHLSFVKRLTSHVQRSILSVAEQINFAAEHFYKVCQEEDM